MAALAGLALFERDPELVTGRAFLRSGQSRALVIDGPPGIGKSAVWRALVNVAREDGHLVLECTGHAAEARLTFAGLTDLLGAVGNEAFARLPGAQAGALKIALLRADAADAAEPASPVDPRAVASGALGVLRELASRQPVLVAIDDVPWLDGASADAITFAARRLGSDRVRFLLAKRTGEQTELERALADELTRLSVGPLSPGAIRHMLANRLSVRLPQHLVGRIFAATLGNPLFALELGRALAEQGLPAQGLAEQGEALPVPETVEELLVARVTGLPRPVRRLLLAVALGGEIEFSRLGDIGRPADLDEAIELGLALITRQQCVRASHPLLAAAARKHSTPGERRELHLALAAVAADDELRARHLALACHGPDEQLAATVAAAAGRAFARGARREAAELGEHALRLTPARSAEHLARLLTLADFLHTAGETQRLKELLTANLDSIPAGPPRARALVLFADVATRHLDDYRECLEQARAEAEADPGLHALIVARMSSAVITVEQIADAEKQALEVLPAAERAGPEIERAVLYALAWARVLRGVPIDDVCERWDAASASPGNLAVSPTRLAAQRHLWRGELGAARQAFERLLTLSEDRGEIGSYIWARLHLCELALQAGDWPTAQRLLDEAEQTAEGEFYVEPYHQRCRALLAACRDLPDEAARWIDDAIGRAEAIDFQWDWLEGLRARGITALLAGEPGRAADSLGTVWEHITREGVEEPGVFPVAPDLVEALIELGEDQRALAVTSRLRMLATRQEHPWGLITAARCGALIRLVTPPYDVTAAAELAATADSYGRLGLRFDRGRTLLALGRAERKLRKWAAARRSLELAAATFDEIGSAGWAAYARSEAGRIGARRPGGTGELTPTERRVVELAAAGHSNKEIARTLFVSINTVEGHLSHAYAKLGVRSRAQLARRLASDGNGEKT
jgi:DNA-binding CsgD family transcriptional regulator